MVEISQHAIYKFIERTKSNKPIIKIIQDIERMLENSKPVELKDKYRISAIINNGFKDSEYRRYGDWIIVLRDNKVITVYKPYTKRKFYENKRKSYRNGW
jgi:hypothetical protein